VPPGPEALPLFQKGFLSFLAIFTVVDQAAQGLDALKDLGGKRQGVIYHGRITVLIFHRIITFCS